VVPPILEVWFPLLLTISKLIGIHQLIQGEIVLALV